MPPLSSSSRATLLRHRSSHPGSDHTISVSYTHLDEEAKQKAYADIAGNVGLAALGGATSGVIMGGGAQAPVSYTHLEEPGRQTASLSAGLGQRHGNFEAEIWDI